MRQLHIRHLPVLDAAGSLCGLVSEREVRVVKLILGEESTVEDAMAEEPVVVTAEASLAEVVAIMGERKLGAVVVTGKRGIEGIFTATDACQAFAQFLQRAAA